MRILKNLAMMTPASAFAMTATLDKNPQCGCCEGHAEHLRANGIDVKSVATHDLTLVRQEQSVPMDFVGCHMMLIDSYVVESHVSAAAVKRLLADRSVVKGISLPGMPVGSPGMERPRIKPLVTYTFGGNDEPQVFAVE
ncbi:DUF411 domain-containing protein [Skermanella mucosa]|uniref:DUF411 domain-containing protein n=1 Tax=Skermanella mucosa TaxID=1789672 RepID=UPI00192ACB71|nr:DUF411 domain-containing protein [Skermanella mucosa]UEM21318.1 DUF411 domain-containing protein [Skermanella mucosa]